MKLRQILSYLWRLVVCGLAYVVGTFAGSMLAGLVGMQTPPLPQGTDAQTLMLSQLLTSPLLALALAILSPGMGGGFLARWLILSFLTWVTYSVNTLLEAAIFTTTGAATPFTALIQLAGSLVCGAAVAALFHPQDPGRGFFAELRKFFARRTAMDWGWRLALAAVAFMPIYLFFGRLVVPFTYEYYQQELVGLTAPGWGQILPVLFVRSVLFLAAWLPVLVTWRTSRRGLVLSLGFALFVLVGALGLIGGYWMPVSMRLFHGLEILADSLVYSWVIVILLWARPKPEQSPKEQA
jgi:hypothetical protein